MIRKKYIVYGAGMWGIRICQALDEQKIECFVDSDMKKIGSEIQNKPVKNIEFLSKNCKDYNVIIATNVLHALEIEKKLRKLGINESKKIYEVAELPQEARSTYREEYNNAVKLEKSLEKNITKLWEKISLKSYKTAVLPKKNDEIDFWIDMVKDMLEEKIKITEYRQAYAEDDWSVEIMQYINECIISENLIQYFFNLWSSINRKISESRNEQKEHFEISRLDFMITEKCSLKCKECLNLMPYYQKPRNYDMNELRDSINIIMHSLDCIRELRVLGGEPLMNPQFYEICKYLCAIDNILHVVVFTNSTIPLKQEYLEMLNKSKLIFFVSDYGLEKQHIDENIKLLQSNGILYYIEDFSRNPWIKNTNFKKIEINANKKELYTNCTGRDCPVVIKNKIFVCEYMANASNLEAIPNDKRNYIRISEENEKTQLKNYLMSNQPKPACLYCDRWVRTEKSCEYVKPAVQVDTPILYYKYER